MNIRKENLGPLDPIFPLDKNANKGYNGLKQEPISALEPDTNSLYDPEHTEKYDEQSFLQGMYGDDEGKRLYQEEVKKQINDALKTIKSGEVLKSLSRSAPITDSAPTDNKIAQKPTETLTLRDPEHIENYDEESFLKGMYGDDEGAKIYKQQLATEKAETVTPPLQTAAVTMPKTSTIPSVAKLTDTTPAQSRVAVSDTTARAEAPLAPLAQVNYAVPPSTFLSTKNTTAPKTYAATSVGITATSGKPKAETAKATTGAKNESLYDSVKRESEQFSNVLKDCYNKAKKAIQFAGGILDKAQKYVQRSIWREGAQKYLREANGFQTSAWMLEHALQDNPSAILRGNDSNIARLINEDSVYLTKLDEAIKASEDGTIDADLKDIRFEKDDLYYSIHKANIHVKGHRQSNGKWLVHATLIDKYDFTELMTLMDGGGWSTQVGLGTVANDMAVVSQKLRAINPYWVCVEFDTWR